MRRVTPQRPGGDRRGRSPAGTGPAGPASPAPDAALRGGRTAADPVLRESGRRRVRQRRDGRRRQACAVCRAPRSSRHDSRHDGPPAPAAGPLLRLPGPCRDPGTPRIAERSCVPRAGAVRVSRGPQRYAHPYGRSGCLHPRPHPGPLRAARHPGVIRASVANPYPSRSPVTASPGDGLRPRRTGQAWPPPSPASRASRAAWTRLPAPRAPRIRLTCALTVLSRIPSAPAISALESPCASRARTSLSRGVRPPTRVRASSTSGRPAWWKRSIRRRAAAGCRMPW